jgi:hypothetical protein
MQVLGTWDKQRLENTDVAGAGGSPIAFPRRSPHDPTMVAWRSNHCARALGRKNAGPQQSGSVPRKADTALCGLHDSGMLLAHTSPFRSLN